MFNIFTPQETITVKAPALELEGLQEQQAPQEFEQVNQLEREEIDTVQENLNQLSTTNNQHFVKLNLLDTLEFITEKITKLSEPTTYLQARSEFLQTFKLCLKLLERHEENTFIPMLEKADTDTLRLGRYEISFKPSKKTVIDEGKLKNALQDPNQIKVFLKQPEFKTLPECRRLLLNLGILSDVFTIKEGKKPILNIIDTNTVKRKLEMETETEEAEAGTVAGEWQEMSEAEMRVEASAYPVEPIREDQLYK